MYLIVWSIILHAMYYTEYHRVSIELQHILYCGSDYFMNHPDFALVGYNFN